MNQAKLLRNFVKFVTGTGLATSTYGAYSYCNEVGFKWNLTFKENYDVFKVWLTSKSEATAQCTEDVLVTYLQRWSHTKWFHKFNLASFMVQLANSDYHRLHTFGTRLLTSIELPTDDSLQNLRDQCSWKVLVGIARSRSYNERWFVKNTNVEKCKIENLPELLSLLKVLVSTLPKRDTDPCYMWMYSSTMTDDDLDTLNDNFQVHSQFGDDLIFQSNNDPTVKVSDIHVYLKMLQHYSTDAKQLDANALFDVIPVMKTILTMFSDDNSFVRTCAEILANLSTDFVYQQRIAKFLPFIIDWKKGEDFALEVIADRILANLDILIDKEVLLEGVYLLHPVNRIGRDEQYDVDIIFVHGIWGSPFYTWRQNEIMNAKTRTDNTICWPKYWLASDLPNTRILSLAYDSEISTWFHNCPHENNKQSLQHQAVDLREKLKSCGVGTKPIVWVAHSMGGLLVKQLLVDIMNENDISTNQSGCSNSTHDDEDILRSTSGIVFYSTPHFGSPIATTCNSFSFLLLPSTQAYELIEHTEMLNNLHNLFRKCLDQFQVSCVNFCEQRATSLPYLKMKSQVVPLSSCDVGYGKTIHCDVNHLEICKPKYRQDVIYSEVFNMVENILKAIKDL